MSILFNDQVRAEKDRDHYFTDGSSNLDGHLMVATEKYLGDKKTDFSGFKEYMRAVFARPFVMKKDLKEWFEKHIEKSEGDESVRDSVLRDLQSELNL